MMRGRNRSVMLFRVGLIKPVKELVVGRSVKATDHAWREALWGLGGSKRRLGRVILGQVDGQPLALVAELQTEIEPGTPVWLIDGAAGRFAIGGPAIIYNEAGYGPASLGISIDELKRRVTFNPDLDAISDAIERTASAGTDR